MALDVLGMVQIGLTVKDLTKAKEFYGDVLELNLAVETDMMLFFTVGGLRLMVGLENQAGTAGSGGSIFYLETRNIHEAHDHISEKGVQILRPPFIAHSETNFEMWLCFFQDEDGNVLAFVESRTI